MKRSLQVSNNNNLSRRGDGMPEIQVRGDKDFERIEYLFIVEGDSELFYIQYLSVNGKLNFDIMPYKGQVKDSWKIENGIICMCGEGFSVDNFNDLRNSMVCEMRPKVICIFDLDVCRKNSTLLKKYKKLLDENLKDDRKFDYYFCTSMPSIEYWFLLHYQKFNENKFYDKIKSCNNISIEISKDKDKDFLDSGDAKKWFAMLCEEENLTRAISRAKAKSNHPHRLDRVEDRMDCDVSYSDMYKLFDII